jgi:translation initiation factor RLI1
MLENNLKAIIKPQYIEQIPKAVKVKSINLLQKNILQYTYNLQILGYF